MGALFMQISDRVRISHAPSISHKQALKWRLLALHVAKHQKLPFDYIDGNLFKLSLLEGRGE